MAEQTTPEAGVEQDDSVARMQNYLTQFDQDQAAEPSTAQPSSEQSAATETPQAEAQAEEVTVDDLPDPQADADAFEIVHNGAQVKLTRADTIKYAQQGFDYDRKTQALAEERRSVQERARLLQAYEQMVPHLTADKAQVDAIGAELGKYQQVNWVALAQSNPQEYPVIRAQYDQMVSAYQAAVGRLGQRQQQVQAQFSQAMQQYQARERAALRDRVPAWKDDSAFQKDAPLVADYLRAEGYLPHEIDNLYDSRQVALAYKAMRYDQLQRAKADKVKQLRTAPPVTRPGAAVSGGQMSADRQQKLADRLKRTGDVMDAAALLATRL